MNKAITDGLLLTPPGFAAGLGAWSREDGTPGSATWATAPNASIVTADQDFGSCLEITKQADTTRIRFMGETPILPGCYLRITARVKAVTGNLPSVRVAGWPGDAARRYVSGLTETGPAEQLAAYGRVVEVSAIVGTGRRGGVDMIWGTRPIYGHFGLDLTGPNGGTLRIESIRIEDVTGAFMRDMMDWVDVRDFGAVGDGVTDDRAAFIAADQAAAGGQILVPQGEYYIASDLSIRAPIRFQGKLKMPTARLALLSSFDFPTYADAFGDETTGMKKAIQALLGYTDHGTLDLRGRRVDLTEPLDIAAIAPAARNWSNRRVIANGQICVVPGAAWDTRSVTSSATYDTGRPNVLTNVANIANIEVGSRISGPGVGREVYVSAVNLANREISLSAQLYGGSGTRSYTFERYRYVFDFSGMDRCDRINFSDVEFILDGVASGIMLPASGSMFHIRDCFIARPRDRGVTSIGAGCQDLLIDRCQFLSNEMTANVADRTTVAINVNANDTKIRDNRFVRFCHFMVAGGAGHMIVGNHWFQGDNSNAGIRNAGLVLTGLNIQTTITGNYIDNNSVEWTNEHHAGRDFGPNQYSFGGLTLTGNTFLCHQTVPWFSFIVVKPMGTGHHIHGLTVQGNVFKAMGTKIERVERIDTTHADVDYTRMRNIQFDGNTFNGVDTFVANPLNTSFTQATAQTVWSVPMGTQMCFNAWAKNVDSLIAETMIVNASGQRVTEMPWVQTQQGATRKELRVNWSVPARGRITLKLRMDNPD